MQGDSYPREVDLKTIKQFFRSIGPYKVLQRIGSMAYKLEFPPSSHVHLVFHVYFLKKVIGDKIPVQTILPKINEE